MAFFSAKMIYTYNEIAGAHVNWIRHITTNLAQPTVYWSRSL